MLLGKNLGIKPLMLASSHGRGLLDFEEEPHWPVYTSKEG